jgi:hypothetical protein
MFPIHWRTDVRLPLNLIRIGHPGQYPEDEIYHFNDLRGQRQRGKVVHE